MTPEQAQEIARLRDLNASPKQIARKLGLRPAEVSEEIRKLATRHAAERGATQTLAPLDACWVNRNAYECLLNPDTNLSEENRKLLDNGLAIVMVVRQPRFNQYELCNYLVDYWCLGIKNALGPQKLKGSSYPAFLEKVYEAYDGEYLKISIEQAQSIIFSALEYSEKLGFKPHKDFEAAKAHLGPQLDYAPLECGRQGQPCFFPGPHDNTSQIIETLTQTMGEGNFDYVTDVSQFN